MPILETVALLAWAAKKAYDQNKRNGTPKCAVASCGGDAHGHSTCCEQNLCRFHCNAHQQLVSETGRCPICNARR